MGPNRDQSEMNSYKPFDVSTTPALGVADPNEDFAAAVGDVLILGNSRLNHRHADDHLSPKHRNHPDAKGLTELSARLSSSLSQRNDSGGQCDLSKDCHNCDSYGYNLYAFAKSSLHDDATGFHNNCDRFRRESDDNIGNTRHGDGNYGKRDSGGAQGHRGRDGNGDGDGDKADAGRGDGKGNGGDGDGDGDGESGDGAEDSEDEGVRSESVGDGDGDGADVVIGDDHAVVDDDDDSDVMPMNNMNQQEMVMDGISDDGDEIVMALPPLTPSQRLFLHRCAFVMGMAIPITINFVIIAAIHRYYPAAIIGGSKSGDIANDDPDDVFVWCNHDCIDTIMFL